MAGSLCRTWRHPGLRRPTVLHLSTCSGGGEEEEGLGRYGGERIQGKEGVERKGEGRTGCLEGEKERGT